MASLDVLVVQDRLLVLPQPRRHLAGVARVHAIIASGGRDQHRWIAAVTGDVVVGGESSDECPLLGLVGVAVLAHPTRTGQQRVEPPHVEQGHLADDRPEEIGPQAVHVAHQEAAVAAPHDAQVRRRRDLPRHEILGDRDEILVGSRPLLLEGRLMPAGTKLTATANVGDHEHVPLLQPRRSRQRGVARHERDLEAAVAVEQCGRGAVCRQSGGADLEVGNPRAILRHGLVLRHPEPLRGEECGCLFEFFRSGAGSGCRPQRECRRLEWARRHQPVIIRLDFIDRCDRRRAKLGHSRQRRAAPRAVPVREHIDPAADVVERGQHEVVSGSSPGGERRAIGRLEEHVQGPLPLQEVLEGGDEQGPGRKRRAVHRPRGAELDQEPFAMHRGAGVVGLVDLDQLAVSPEEHFVGPERDLPDEKIPLEAGREVGKSADRHVVRPALEDRLCVCQRRAAGPLPHRPRVARGGERSGAHVGGHEQAPAISPGDPALCLGQCEAPVHKRLLLEVELPDDVGVGPAPRQRYQAGAVFGFEDRRAVPDPVLPFGLRQRVDIDHRLPGGLRRAVAVERGSPPQTLWVRGVPPQVVEVVADPRDERDPLLGVEDREESRFKCGECLPLGERLSALGVSLADPLQLLLAHHVFQPEVWINGLIRGCAGGLIGDCAGGLNGEMVSGRRAEGGAVHEGHHEEQEEKRGTSGGHERVCPVPVTMYL